MFAEEVATEPDFWERFDPSSLLSVVVLFIVLYIILFVYFVNLYNLEV